MFASVCWCHANWNKDVFSAPNERQQYAPVTDECYSLTRYVTFNKNHIFSCSCDFQSHSWLTLELFKHLQNKCEGIRAALISASLVSQGQASQMQITVNISKNNARQNKVRKSTAPFKKINTQTGAESMQPLPGPNNLTDVSLIQIIINLTKMLALSLTVTTKLPGSGPAPEWEGIFPDQRPIPHPTLVQIGSILFCPTDQPKGTDESRPPAEPEWKLLCD